MEVVTGHLILEEDLVLVAEYMERVVTAERLSYVANRLPALAKLIWSDERCAHLERSAFRNETPQVASVSVLEPERVDGDFAAVADVDVLK